MNKSYLMILIQIKKRNLNKNKKTPLQIALESKSDEIGKLLISKGAEGTVKLIISRIIRESILIIIIEIKERNLIKINRTLLHYAAKNDLKKIGKLLISKGADINAKDIIYQIINNHF